MVCYLDKYSNYGQWITMTVYRSNSASDAEKDWKYWNYLKFEYFWTLIGEEFIACGSWQGGYERKETTFQF